MHLIHMIRPDLFGERADGGAGAGHGAEWDLFTGRVIVAGGAGPPPPSWAQAERAPAFAALAQAMPHLAALPFNDSAWSRWGGSERCEIEWPPSMPRDTSNFHKILILQAMQKPSPSPHPNPHPPPHPHLTLTRRAHAQTGVFVENLLQASA